MSGRVHAEAKVASKSSFTPVRAGLLAGSYGKLLVSQPPLIQAKLTINQPNDRYEQEADRVADAVMRMPEPGVQRQVEPEEEEEEETLQTKPLANQITPLIQRRIEPEEEEEPIQAKQTNGQTLRMSPILQTQIHSLRGGGQPLSPSLRNFFEPRFGHDFSRVRVHTDARAAESARTVNALAYTVVPNIVFNKGEYAPQTTAGKELLAHELTHVVQQRTEAVPARTNLTIGAANDAHELEADESAESAVQGNIMNRFGFSQTPPHLQRACGPPAIGNVGDCIRRGGDITDFGGSSDRLILFDVNCDEFLPGEVSKLRRLAPTILPNDIVEIDGFASEEGDPTFNDNLSCARAHAAESELLRQSVAATIVLFEHGATPGFRDDRRSAVISLPAPTPGCTTPTNPDLSGSANNPTTDSKTEVVLTNLIDAISAKGAANDASAAAAASGLAGPHLGPQDAFRHCVWNCLMTQRIGASEAEKFATSYENSGPSLIPFDNQMDLHNNATGRSLGTPGTNCSTACRGALTSGQLQTIRGPNTRPQATPPVPTAFIDASDQPWP